MLFLIGLGLNERGISLEGIESLKNCEKVYIENYTVNFPYSFDELENVLGKKLINADRDLVESNKIVPEAKNGNVALLVYGSPLTATTHISLIEEAKKQEVEYRIIYSGSVFDGIAETGLQIYKFGKIASMPMWRESFNPTSFADIIKENQSINAHSLILIDIGLELPDAINELQVAMEEKGIQEDKILVCSELGTKNQKMIYDKVENFKNTNVNKPYCIIIPGKLHFFEEEVLKNLPENQHL